MITGFAQSSRASPLSHSCWASTDIVALRRASRTCTTRLGEGWSTWLKPCKLELGTDLYGGCSVALTRTFNLFGRVLPLALQVMFTVFFLQHLGMGSWQVVSNHCVPDQCID
jgi:hypothetical protein